MSTDAIRERAQLLETLFFNEKESKLLEHLHNDLQQSKSIASLAAVAHIGDRDALEELEEIGINPSTFVAVKLIPMIAVAWADDDLEDEEIEAIQRAAEKAGIKSGSPSDKLLHQWLRDPMGNNVIDAWTHFISVYSNTLDPAKRAALEKETIDSAIEVAASAGGFLGLGAVSRVEDEMIKRLRQAFR
jgi:hypothetical protein